MEEVCHWQLLHLVRFGGFSHEPLSLSWSLFVASLGDAFGAGSEHMVDLPPEDGYVWARFGVVQAIGFFGVLVDLLQGGKMHS